MVHCSESNSALPEDDDDDDDDDVDDYTETCWRCLNINFNVNFKIVIKTIQMCISWWIKRTLIEIRYTVCIWGGKNCVKLIPLCWCYPPA
jgi:hypothetical protein